MTLKELKDYTGTAAGSDNTKYAMAFASVLMFAPLLVSAMPPVAGILFGASLLMSYPCGRFMYFTACGKTPDADDIFCFRDFQQGILAAVISAVHWLPFLILSVLGAVCSVGIAVNADFIPFVFSETEADTAIWILLAVSVLSLFLCIWNAEKYRLMFCSVFSGKTAAEAVSDVKECMKGRKVIYLVSAVPLSVISYAAAACASLPFVYSVLSADPAGPPQYIAFVGLHPALLWFAPALILPFTVTYGSFCRTAFSYGALHGRGCAGSYYRDGMSEAGAEAEEANSEIGRIYGKQNGGSGQDRNPVPAYLRMERLASERQAPGNTPPVPPVQAVPQYFPQAPGVPYPAPQYMPPQNPPYPQQMPVVPYPAPQYMPPQNPQYPQQAPGVPYPAPQYMPPQNPPYPQQAPGVPYPAPQYMPPQNPQYPQNGQYR